MDNGVRVHRPGLPRQARRRLADGRGPRPARSFRRLFSGQSALRNVQVAGKTTPVIDIRITARNGGEKAHFVKCVRLVAATRSAVSDHLEVGRTVSVVGTPRSASTDGLPFARKAGRFLLFFRFVP